MYDFAIVALLALATLKLVDFLTDAVPQLRNLRSLATFVIGVGATVLIDYSLFRGFGIGIRNDTHTPGDDPVGGSFLFALGAEINQPIYKDIFSVVGFVDTGTVQKHFGFSEYRVSAGFGVRFYIRQLSPLPIAFDFGFPILSQDTDRQRVLTFSLDVPYQ